MSSGYDGFCGFTRCATRAIWGRVNASTQNQALAALLFLYRTVLGAGW